MKLWKVEIYFTEAGETDVQLFSVKGRKATNGQLVLKDVFNWMAETEYLPCEEGNDPEYYWKMLLNKDLAVNITEADLIEVH